MTVTISSLFFMVGVCFGSFFNVIGLRTPQKISFLSDRSRCFHCHQTLSWYELIPIFSYLCQLGKCRKCKSTISILYPFVEALTGVLYLLAYLQFDFTPHLFQALLLISLCVIIFVTDFTYMVIPNKILIFFLPFFIFSNIILPLEDWYNSIFGAMTGFILIGMIIIISSGGMGVGDMKLLAVLGLLLGFEKILLTFFIAVCAGSIMGIGLMIWKKKKRHHAIPFAPFLALAAMLSYTYGDYFISYYVALLQW